MGEYYLPRKHGKHGNLKRGKENGRRRSERFKN